MHIINDAPVQNQDIIEAKTGLIHTRLTVTLDS